MKSKNYWYLMVVEHDIFNNGKRKKSNCFITIQKSEPLLENQCRIRYIREVEEISLVVDLNKERIKLFNYDQDPDMRDFYSIKYIIEGPLKNKEIGQWIYDECISVVDLDFWEFMKERKRGKDRKMVEKIKERLRPAL